MKYPTREECLEFYKEINTPENIIRHVTAVNKVAMFLAQKLIEKGEKINLLIVDRASLLHDLDKWLVLNDKTLRHGFHSEKILTEKGYPELGFYARQHVADLVLLGYKTWEEKIITYSDMRVLGDKVVSTNERFEYINKKYPPKDLAQREKRNKMLLDVEKEICSRIGISPDNLADAVAQVHQE